MNYEEEGKRLIDEAASAAERAEVRAHDLKMEKLRNKSEGWDPFPVLFVGALVALAFSVVVAASTKVVVRVGKDLDTCEQEVHALEVAEAGKGRPQ